MARNPRFPRHADDGRQAVAPKAQVPGTRAGAGVLLACAGHAGTFLALAAGGLWLAVRGPGAFPATKGLLVGGLYMQLLPALGFALLASERLRVGRLQAALATAAVSATSLGLMGAGLLQMASGHRALPLLLTLTLASAAAGGLGLVAGGTARLIRDRFESEPLIILDPEPEC